MIAFLAMQAAATGVAAYGECLTARINADERMVRPPAEVASRVAIFEAAKAACADARKGDAAMLDRVDASMRAVLANPNAAEVADGEGEDTP